MYLDNKQLVPVLESFRVKTQFKIKSPPKDLQPYCISSIILVYIVGFISISPVVLWYTIKYFLSYIYSVSSVKISLYFVSHITQWNFDSCRFLLAFQLDNNPLVRLKFAILRI